MGINTNGAKALGEAVKQERLRLQFATSKELANAIGVSARLVGDIENGRRSSYSSRTLGAIDRELRWPPGTARELLEGGDVQLPGVGAGQHDDAVTFSAEDVSITVSPESVHVGIQVSVNESVLENADRADLIGAAYRARDEFKEALYRFGKRGLGRGVGVLIPRGMESDLPDSVARLFSDHSVFEGDRFAAHDPGYGPDEETGWREDLGEESQAPPDDED
ncbi:MAG: helix-turn-helix transcriptional regulator [Actinomycetaceae bacterium]|nr:helix-turn-helix transcriptional regulator [Actinomycetaceae bacterium]